MNYTIPKPRPSIAVYALSVVVLLGLVALFIAAFFAFSEVMPWYQALFAAVLIEAGAVVEALAFARDNNKIAAAGLIFSLVVSVTYNYIQAQQAGAGRIDNWWQLLTLAVGPLSALTFLSLTLGSELREHRREVEAWEQERQAFAEKETRRLERKRAREKKRQEAAEYRRLTARKPADDSASHIDDWRKVPEEMLPEIAEMSPKEVQAKFPMIAPRTARSWSKKAQKALKERETTRVRPVSGENDGGKE